MIEPKVVSAVEPKCSGSTPVTIKVFPSVTACINTVLTSGAYKKYKNKKNQIIIIIMCMYT